MGRSYSEKMRARQRSTQKKTRPRKINKSDKSKKEGFPFAPVVLLSIIILLVISTVVLYLVQDTDEGNDTDKGYAPGDDDDTTDLSPHLRVGIESVDRGVITLEEHIGKVVVLDMFATWCSPCQQQMYELIELQSIFSESQVVIISVDADLSETLSQVRDFKEGYPEAKWTFATSNSDLNRYFPASSIPTLYILDRNGQTADTHVGLTSADDIAGRIEGLL